MSINLLNPEWVVGKDGRRADPLDSVTAYDYDAQRWTSGIEAFWLRTHQLLEERDLLLHDAGYASMMGYHPDTLASRVSAAEGELRALWNGGGA